MSHKLDPKIYNLVRLKPHNLDVIIYAFKENFAETDQLWIFGSRVNMQARGGDIDLYIETAEKDPNIISERHSKFISAIWKKIGEQKIDVVINMINSETKLPIYSVALNTGVKLV